MTVDPALTALAGTALGGALALLQSLISERTANTQSEHARKLAEDQRTADAVEQRHQERLTALRNFVGTLSNLTTEAHTPTLGGGGTGILNIAQRHQLQVVADLTGDDELSALVSAHDGEMSPESTARMRERVRELLRGED